MDLKNDSCVDGTAPLGCVGEPREDGWIGALPAVLLPEDFAVGLPDEADDGTLAVLAPLSFRSVVEDGAITGAFDEEPGVCADSSAPLAAEEL